MKDFIAASAVPAVILAFLLDCLLGDPVYRLHPVRIMGRAASLLEKRLYPAQKPAAPSRLFAAGTLGWFLIVGGAGSAGFFIPFGMKLLAEKIIQFLPASSLAQGWEHLPSILFLFAQALLIYTTIAPRDMAGHALNVKHALEQPHASAAKQLEDGRRAVAMIVGRDVERLDREGVIRAAIESVAESTIDGVIAPLFWAFIAGSAGALAYRAVNTLDSMWGHTSGRYFWFGKTAARADDLANYLPARLGFIAGAIAIGFLRLFSPAFHPLRAIKIGLRDHAKHASPNSAWMEALTAGALSLALAGPAWYSGEFLPKEWIGAPHEKCRPPKTADIQSSIQILYGAALVFISGALLLGLFRRF